MTIENQILKRAADLSSEVGKARKGFVKNLITVSTGFLALFIGLNSENIPSANAKYFFFITIVLLVLGILFSTISLFQEIYYLRKNEKFLKEKMTEYLEKGTIGTNLFNFTNKPFFFKACEFIGFGSLVLSTLTLVGYIFFLMF